MTRSLAVLLVWLLSACASKPQDETKNWTPDKIYSEAKAELNAGNYKKAIVLYEKLQSRYPYGRYAQQAELEIAYAHFKDSEPVQALAAADRFIKLHPDHPSLDYAFYLKGLINFHEDLGLIGGLFQSDLSDRDPKGARESFDAFRELVTRFPQSRYAADATARMTYLVNTLAGGEVRIAEYYLRRQAYVAAVSRAQFVVTNYPQAPAVERALLVMVAAYDAMGVQDLRADAQRLLNLNYPNSKLKVADLKKNRKWWDLW
jgi:outer membrane protein assembly factor BamD